MNWRWGEELKRYAERGSALPTFKPEKGACWSETLQHPRLSCVWFWPLAHCYTRQSTQSGCWTRSLLLWQPPLVCRFERSLFLEESARPSGSQLALAVQHYWWTALSRNKPCGWKEKHQARKTINFKNICTPFPGRSLFLPLAFSLLLGGAAIVAIGKVLTRSEVIQLWQLDLRTCFSLIVYCLCVAKGHASAG